jgi:hypothetical protein
MAFASLSMSPTASLSPLTSPCATGAVDGWDTGTKAVTGEKPTGKCDTETGAELEDVAPDKSDAVDSTETLPVTNPTAAKPTPANEKKRIVVLPVMLDHYTTWLHSMQ